MFRKKIDNLFVFSVLSFVLCSVLSFGEVKTITLPGDITVQENLVEGTEVSNLSTGGEIFKTGWMYYIDGAIYMARYEPTEVVKINMDGKIAARMTKKGQGPGEVLLILGISTLGDRIAVSDYQNMKVTFYNKDLEFIDEQRLKRSYFGFYVNNQSEFVFYTSPYSREDDYFRIYTQTGKYLRGFGKKVLSKSARTKRYEKDGVFIHRCVPGEDGVWASFKGRYDLKYYKNEKPEIEIKAPDNVFGGKEVREEGIKRYVYKGRAVHLAHNKQHLYYFFSIDGNRYCDIFDGSTYRFQRRIKLGKKYRSIVHIKEKLFYAMGYRNNADDEEEVILYKFKL